MLFTIYNIVDLPLILIIDLPSYSCTVYCINFELYISGAATQLSKNAKREELIDST